MKLNLKMKTSKIKTFASTVLLSCLSVGSHADYKTILIENSLAWESTIADYNNDGHDDILINGHDPYDRIWYWTKSGYLPSKQIFPYDSQHFDRHACDAADVNQDGLLDLYCTNGSSKGTGSKTNELYLQKKSGIFTLQADGFGAEDYYGRGRRVVFFNLNHDKYPDLYVTNFAAPRDDGQQNSNSAYLNVFKKQSDLQTRQYFKIKDTQASGKQGSLCVGKGDINQDGWDDIITCDKEGTGHLYINDQHNNFTDVINTLFAGNRYWQDAKLDDLNHDGFKDLIVITRSNMLHIYLNKQQGQLFGEPDFSAILPFIGVSVAIGDFNRDGNRDIYVVLRDIDCLNTLRDKAPDIIYFGTDHDWVKEQLQQNYAGCGYLADVVDGNKILLMNGGDSWTGPSYLIGKKLN